MGRTGSSADWGGAQHPASGADTLLSLSTRQEVSSAYSLAGMQTVSCFPILCVPEDIAQSKMFIIIEITDSMIWEESHFQGIKTVFVKSLISVSRNATSPRQRTCKVGQTKQKPRTNKSFQLPRDLGTLRTYSVREITPHGFPKKGGQNRFLIAHSYFSAVQASALWAES